VGGGNSSGMADFTSSFQADTQKLFVWKKNCTKGNSKRVGNMSILNAELLANHKQNLMGILNICLRTHFQL